MDAQLLRDLQNQLSARDRELVASRLARGRPAAGIPESLVERFAPTVRKLREHGAVSLGRILPTGMCDAIRDHFLAEPCYPSHVPVYATHPPRPLQIDGWKSPYGSYATRSALEAPGFLKVVMCEPVMGTVIPYFGCLPLVYSVNTFWTLPNRAGAMTHGYHRDLDDYRFLSVFVFWTDVPQGEGEFQFLDGTHDHRQTEAILAASPHAGPLRRSSPDLTLFDALRFSSTGGAGYGQDTLYAGLFAGRESTFSGPRGTAVVADTFGLHRGTRPATQARLVTWIRFGLYENAACVADRNRAPALRAEVASQFASWPFSEMFKLLLPR